MTRTPESCATSSPPGSATRAGPVDVGDRTAFRGLVEHLQRLQPSRPLGRARLGAVERSPGQRPRSRVRGRPGGVRQGSLTDRRTGSGRHRSISARKRTPRISGVSFLGRDAANSSLFRAFFGKAGSKITEIVEPLEHLVEHQLVQAGRLRRRPRPRPRCAARRRRAAPGRAASRGRSSSWRRCSGSSRGRPCPAAATWSSSTRRGPGASSVISWASSWARSRTWSAECGPGQRGVQLHPLAARW